MVFFQKKKKVKLSGSKNYLKRNGDKIFANIELRDWKAHMLELFLSFVSFSEAINNWNKTSKYLKSLTLFKQAFIFQL